MDPLQNCVTILILDYMNCTDLSVRLIFLKHGRPEGEGANGVVSPLAFE